MELQSQFKHGHHKVVKVDRAIEVGRLLTSMKGRIPRGDFIIYLRSDEFPLGKRTAQRYMKLYRNRGILSRCRSIRQCIARIIEKRREPNGDNRTGGE